MTKLAGRRVLFNSEYLVHLGAVWKKDLSGHPPKS
jgi:hypothetical protein